MSQAALAMQLFHRDRKLSPEEWLLIANHLKRSDILALSRSSRWLSQVMAKHPKGYMTVTLPEADPSLLEARLDKALEYADTADRRVGIVAPPAAIGDDTELGKRVVARLTASGLKIMWMEITLPTSLAAEFHSLVRALNPARLEALHASLSGATPATLDLSNAFASAPDKLGGLRNVQYLQLAGRGDNRDWPADWRAAVSALATYVPVINVRLLGVDVENVDIGPLLHGLGAGPLVVAFPDTCAAPGHAMVSTEDGSVVRRLQWGWGDAVPGLMRPIYAQLAPVASQVVVVHVDSTVLETEDAPSPSPLLSSLRQIAVHSIMGPYEAEDSVDLDTETPAERAARVDIGGPEYTRELKEYAKAFFNRRKGTVFSFWCPHCGNPDAIPAEVRAGATATPGPSA